MNDAEIAAARAKMIAKRFGGATVSTGGKGTVRRKKNASSRSSAAQSDAKLSVALKKLGATNIPAIEDVKLFKEDGKVIHFENPRIQASIQAIHTLYLDQMKQNHFKICCLLSFPSLVWIIFLNYRTLLHQHQQSR